MLMTAFPYSVLLFIFVLIPQAASERDSLAQALSNLIERNFVQAVGVFNFHINCVEEPQRLSYFSDLIDSTVRETENISVRIGKQLELPTDGQRHYSVLGADSVEAVNLFYRAIGVKHLNIDGNIIIVLKTFNESYYDSLVEIFKVSRINGVVDVNVLVEPIPGLILMFTFYPFSIYSCDSVFPVITNRFIDSKWETDSVPFPAKTANMHGCPMVWATWESLPYLEILHDDEGHEIYSGFEGQLLEYIATQMNFKIRLYIMNETEINGTLDDKGLIFSELFTSGVNCVMGGFHFKPATEEKTVMPSAIYYMSAINIVMSGRGQPLPPVGKLLFPFRPWLWLFVMSCFVLGGFIILMSKRQAQDKRDFILGAKNNSPIYNMFYTALGGGVNKIPKRNFARFLLGLWILLWLVLRNGYQSALFHCIRMDISLPPPDSVEDVIKDGYEIRLTPTVHNTLNNLPLIQETSKFLNGSEVDNFQMLLDVEDKIAIITPYEYFGYFKKMHREQAEAFHLVNENVFTEQLSFYLKRNSIFDYDINASILEYVKTGLVIKFSQNFIEPKVRKPTAPSNDVKEITIIDVLGAFDTYALGMVISLVVFGVEVLVYRLSKNFQ